MAALNQKLGDGRKPIPRSQMQTRITLVFKVRVAKFMWIGADDALNEGQVVEQDGAAEATGYVNPVTSGAS